MLLFRALVEKSQVALKLLWILPFTLPFAESLASKRGQTLAEYGLMIALVALIAIAVHSLLREQIQGVFESILGMFTVEEI
jgi:Flp pilus assembly pilin Flp